MEWEELDPYVPTDHARQVTSQYYIDLLMSRYPAPRLVVDLGCGAGGSLREFRRRDPDVRWIGVDIGDSMEAQARPALDAPVVLYDGVTLPLADGSIDCVYSHQVFEHVRHPLELLREITRVLAPGGWFAGSTSQLEPYHSRSYWNYTVTGFCQLLLEAGLSVQEFRPGIDGPTLIERAFTNDRGTYGRYFSEESPLNVKIDEWARERRRGTGAVNHRKLRFCGQFAFLARRELRAASD